jgi:hypothetical protein
VVTPRDSIAFTSRPYEVLAIDYGYMTRLYLIRPFFCRFPAITVTVVRCVPIISAKYSCVKFNMLEPIQSWAVRSQRANLASASYRRLQPAT